MVHEPPPEKLLVTPGTDAGFPLESTHVPFWHVSASPLYCAPHAVIGAITSAQFTVSVMPSAYGTPEYMHIGGGSESAAFAPCKSRFERRAEYVDECELVLALPVLERLEDNAVAPETENGVLLPLASTEPL